MTKIVSNARPLASFVISLGAAAAATPGLGRAAGTPPPAAGAREAPGPPVDFFDPPPGAQTWPYACSARLPLCVHAAPTMPPERSRAVLAAAERAWGALFGPLSAPPPIVDLDGAWHAYVVGDAPGGGVALVSGLDPRARFDRGLTFGLVDGALAPGCPLDRAVARALAFASLRTAAPATDAGSARAEAEAMARLAAGCGGAEAAEPDAAFQGHPERTIVDPAWPAFDRGAWRFFDWLDRAFAREPGALVVGLWALAPTRTRPGAAWWPASPNGFDVLRVSLRGAFGTDSTLDDGFGRFAVVRARAAPAPRLAWHVGWPSVARRLASPEPVSPTGASYVLVDHAGAPPGARLRVEAQWEDYGRMRWFVVKLDAAGRPLAVVPVTSLDLGTRASMTIESLDGVDRVLVVGADVGSTEHPFEPAQGEWEPHGWLLTLSADHDALDPGAPRSRP